MKKRSEIVMCGSVTLARLYCEDCEEYQLVGVKNKRCPNCEGKLRHTKNVEVRKIGNGVERKHLPKGEIDKLTKEQNGKCYWCGRELNYYYIKKGKIIKSKKHADHIIPYSYLQSNPKNNWAIVCSVCNLIKSDKNFTSEKEIRNYILDKWDSKNFEVLATDHD